MDFRHGPLVDPAWVANGEEIVAEIKMPSHLEDEKLATLRCIIDRTADDTRGGRGRVGRVISSETGEAPRRSAQLALDEATCSIGFCARGRAREASAVC